RAIFLQGRAPAGVVDDDVEEHPCAERMRGMGEFTKLIHAGGEFVEFDERGVNRGQVERGIRAAETSEAREGGRCGMDWQQLENAAAKRLDDMGQPAGEVTERAGGWNDGVTALIERLDLSFELPVVRGR